MMSYVMLFCRDYKSRLSCMSSCFSLYTPMSPHHNLARYCMQASCPAHQEPALHQVRDLPDIA